MKRTMTMTVLLCFMCLLIPLQVKAEETEVKDAQYASGFEKANDYEKFNTDDSELLDHPIWIEGVAKSYNADAKTTIKRISKTTFFIIIIIHEFQSC